MLFTFYNITNKTLQLKIIFLDRNLIVTIKNKYTNGVIQKYKIVRKKYKCFQDGALALIYNFLNRTSLFI